MAGGLCARAFEGCTTTILEAASARCELMAGRTAPEAPGALRRAPIPRRPDHRVAGAVRKGRACVDAAEGERESLRVRGLRGWHTRRQEPVPLPPGAARERVNKSDPMRMDPGEHVAARGRHPQQHRLDQLALLRACPILPLRLLLPRSHRSRYYGNCSSPVFPCEDIAAGPACPSPSKGGIVFNPQAAFAFAGTANPKDH